MHLLAMLPCISKVREPVDLVCSSMSVDYRAVYADWDGVSEFAAKVQAPDKVAE